MAVSAPEGCKDPDPRALAGCVDSSRLRADVTQVARPRPPGSAGWRAVQGLCARTLQNHGFEVELHRYATGINVIGTKLGGAAPHEVVVAGAHYDHIPGCQGADDNASGVAGLLELARVLGPVSFDRTLVLACWDEEERGLVGSRAFAARARARDEAVQVYFNFDAIGYVRPEPNTQRLPTGFDLLFPEQVRALAQRDNRADFIAVIADGRATPFAEAMRAAASELDLPLALLQVPWLLEVAPVAIDLHRSDHASFWDAGYPAIMITDTANFRSPAYHCLGRPDRPGDLDGAFMTKVVGVTVQAMAQALTLESTGTSVDSHADPSDVKIDPMP